MTIKIDSHGNDYQPRRGEMLLTPGFNPGHKKPINRFGVIFDSAAENHDKTHKGVNQYITKS